MVTAWEIESEDSKFKMNRQSSLEMNNESPSSLSLPRPGDLQRRANNSLTDNIDRPSPLMLPSPHFGNESPLAPNLVSNNSQNLMTNLSNLDEDRHNSEERLELPSPIKVVRPSEVSESHSAIVRAFEGESRRDHNNGCSSIEVPQTHPQARDHRVENKGSHFKSRSAKGSSDSISMHEDFFKRLAVIT